MQHISVRNGTIGVLAQGKGTPILFVHGFPLTHSMWRSQVKAFAKSYRVIAPDLRGFGASGLPAGNGVGTLTMEALADDLHGLLHAVFVDGPVILCGLSMGGYIAWQFFQKYRPQLKALILCDTRAAADTPEGAAGRVKLAKQVLAQGSQALLEGMLPRFVAPQTPERHPEVMGDLRTMILHNHGAGIAAALHGLAERPDCTGLLSQIDVPTLLICGQEDQITPLAEMRGMAQAIRGSTLVEIPDAGHMSPMENPDAVNAAISTFLKEVA